MNDMSNIYNSYTTLVIDVTVIVIIHLIRLRWPTDCGNYFQKKKTVTSTLG